jgi:hypothetical protein
VNDDLLHFPLPCPLLQDGADDAQVANTLSELTWRLSNFARRPLLVLAQAIQLMSGEEGNFIQSWKNLIKELEDWREQRPDEFKPIIEVASPLDSDSTFPIILFSNGAGAFGQQMYHTAMLILLLKKPRTVQLSHFPSFLQSSLWHAQCICSIALNNDRRDFWDPSLLASFLFAAKRMSHELQQQNIIHGLDRIQYLTGWDIRSCVVELREHWALVNMV